MKTRLPSVIATMVMMVLLMTGVALAQGKVDINQATPKELMSLKGIGEQKAKAIVKYRQMNGPFQSLDDLINVPGIGKKTIADNKSMIVIGKGTGGKKSSAKGAKTKAKDAKKGAAKKSDKAMSGTKEKAKKGMAGSKDKAKKGMASSKDKSKKGMASSKDKAKKGMTSTAEKSKKAKSSKK